MKKRALSLILALVLCLGLLPTAALASEREYYNRWRDEYADFVLSAEEAARDYGISLSTDRIDFGSVYIGEEFEPVTFTLTNNSDYYITYGQLVRTNMTWFSHMPSGSSGHVIFDEVSVAPGESKDIQARYLRTDHGRSGPDTVDLYVCLDTSENVFLGLGLIKLYIKDILTVDYEIKDADKEIPAGDIKWDLSTTALDLGVSNITKRSNYLSDEYLTGTVTVTNRGSRPMRVESRLDTSGCSWEAIEYIISGDYPAGEYLRPGESTDITIRLQRSSWYETGAIEGCKLNLTAYYPDYPDSREENTLTASIPITAKFLSDGGHVLYYKSDYPKVAFDAQGNELTLDGRVLVVKEGDTVTFVAVPPNGFYVSELLVDKENMWAVDHYTFTNIHSSHEIGYYVERGPAPYTPYVPGQPPVTPTTPVQPEQPVTPGKTETAMPTNDKLMVNGVLANPTVYKIGGSNYFKIRDVAALLNGTEKQFSVGYDGKLKSVTATTGQGYTKLDTDLLGAPAGGNKTAEPSNDTIYINGVKINAAVYKIDGGNYFKLRDLGKALNFGVGWTREIGVMIDTGRPYTE